MDLVKAKDRLLNITAELTCGVVNGQKMQVRALIRPSRAEKRPERDSEMSLNEDKTVPEDSAETNSVLSKEKLKALRSQQGWPHFKDVFMLSSLDSEYIDALKVHARLGS